MEESGIKVACRLKPSSCNSGKDIENENSLFDVYQNQISVKSATENTLLFEYDYVANQNATQDEIFQNIGLPLTKNCVEGFNAAIFTYGQTGYLIYSYLLNYN